MGTGGARHASRATSGLCQGCFVIAHQGLSLFRAVLEDTTCIRASKEQQSWQGNLGAPSGASGLCQGCFIRAHQGCIKGHRVCMRTSRARQSGGGNRSNIRAAYSGLIRAASGITNDSPCVSTTSRAQLGARADVGFEITSFKTIDICDM